MENPMKMDDLGVPLFSETSVSILLALRIGSSWIRNRLSTEVSRAVSASLGSGAVRGSKMDPGSVNASLVR